jgi:hypothetical protein
MRTVFNNDELVHVWASQSQDEGNANSMSFRYGTLYSYAAKIGKIVDGVALLVDRKWSVTTSAHQSLAYGAVSHLTRFRVASVEPDHKDNINHYVDEIKDSFTRYFRARQNKPYIHSENHGWHQEMIAYADYFGINYPASVGAYVLADGDEATAVQLERHKETQVKERKAAKKAIETAQDNWIDGKSNQTSVMSNGKSFTFSHTLVRLDGDNILTSRGARVPARDARILYKAIKAGKPVHGFKIGMYTVTGLNGTLVIGCHSIQRKEIDRLASRLGW